MSGPRPTRMSRNKRRSNRSSTKSGIKVWARVQKPASFRLPSKNMKDEVKPSEIAPVASAPYNHLTALNSIMAHLDQTHNQPRLSSSRRESMDMDTEDQPFRFLDLPAEIRLMIYGHSLTETEPIYMDTLAAPPPLTRVCQQIRQEALPVFLGTNSFVTLFSSVVPSNSPAHATTTYIPSFSPSTQSWLCDQSISQPLIRDLSFALQPSTWDADCTLTADYRIRDGKLTHGSDCPFCSNGSYGNVSSISLSHPALPQTMKSMLVQAQQVHDTQLDNINVAMRCPKALSVCNIIALAQGFVGPAESITKLMSSQHWMVDFFTDALECWKLEGKDGRIAMEQSMTETAEQLWLEKDNYTGSL